MRSKIKFLAFFGAILLLAFKSYNSKKVIVIDAGHGGKDIGAQIGSDLEKKIVENIANKISSLGNNEIEIILLRNDDRFIELSERVEKINKINPSLLISLHVNSSKNATDNGINAYVSSRNSFYEKSLEVAKSLIEKISNEKISKGEVKDSNLFVIKKSKCPAVMLEIGYLSNENDKAYITSENGQNEIANNIVALLKNKN